MTAPLDTIDLDVQIREHVALVTLNRPDARNAYSEAMIRSLMDALDALEDDDAVRCVVLTGAGTAFSAGGDLKLMRDHAGMFEGDPVRLRSRYLRGIHQVPRRLARFDKPIVAAINGPAIGAGLDLACMCDIRVAAEGACFGSTFVKVGLVPGDGGAYLLSRTIGFPSALEMILTGRVIDSVEALRLGLVHQVVPPEQLMEAAEAYAARLCRVPPLAVRMAKSAAYRSWDLGLEQALHVAATYQGAVQNTEDHDEAVQAMLDKRRPTFKGR